ncbi:ankyrin repeat family protein / regulator of chromosome condensation (RCC1) family protein [Melia azedarach]|uniref:Ankyrin repeat family protein / regulator of chromosome condensation (RCC1) family protein n=3 Tax=Melia azedarach TaxID=155640 RepID=A0ACC1YDI1_MELAZ|nr:ankyrin repeat family protein / regulator of chromosome condensation (RCC1) family protein [Melia azedarach]KAJ4721276.1 ankyrin repeat family protein / regulator of chromosome condensation (RCC1) family protein [Melia azedarach]KAJ4721277.1 ankyrin repeat family protein / regulator of chromosome condensation (RCC1) family protein [Melia azedarach]
MEMLISPQGQKQILQSPARKFSPGGFQKDLCLIVREGSLADVEQALALLKKSGGNINSRNTFGLTPLHIAIWRNHIPIVRRLLAAGADPDARDGESGWSGLHRALHFGHLAVASILLQSGASLTLEDCKSRTPVDLLSGPVLQAVGSGHNSVATEVFSWGSGTNYQLGTGNAHIQKLPCKVDSLHGSLIKLISAAKFHSVAVTSRGEVYTWGFGRGGRLGHPDFDIHSGQAAVITPRQVTSGLGSRRVKTIAAAKHHTVLATEGGEVFTWGSNREGQLGYTSVDTQPTPRRVSSLKSKIVAVAAANKHTAVVSESGEVFTWGCNREGQLGYGTSNSASNYTPRVVESLKGKVLAGVAAAKYHTIVLGVDGEVYTWGHRLVTPKRVIIARNLKKSGTTPLKFHRMKRLHVVAIAAGMIHSVALTDDGALFYWASSDPDLRCQQLYSMCGRNVVSISAGKYWTAAVTATGDVYMWDGKKSKESPPLITHLNGVKRATSVSVGETHLLVVGSLYHPIYPPNAAKNPQKLKSIGNDLEDFDEDFMFNDIESNKMLSTLEKDNSGCRQVPSLKSLCEKVAAECMVEPRNSLQLLEIADSLGAEDLRKHCEDIAIRNLDYILTVSSHSFAGASLDILANIEKLLDLRSSESWSYRRLPTPTATFPVVINSEEEDSESEVLRTRDNHVQKSTLQNEGDARLDSFLQPKDDPDQGISKQVRALRKKLQQIEMLELKQSNGHLLDDQQVAKLQTKSALENSLAELGVPIESPQGIASSAASPDGRGNKKAGVSKKQRKKSKQKAAQVDTVSGFSVPDVVSNPIKDFFDVEISEIFKNKEEDAMSEGTVAIECSKQSTFLVQKKENLQPLKNNISQQTATKKKNKSKKGGLSMFLSGALDDNPKDVAPPPPTPRSEGPVWGGAKVSKGPASLREIQDEQSKIKVNQPTRNKDQFEDLSNSRNEGKVLLSSFLTSKSIPVVSTRAQQASDGEKGTPPWAAPGTPPSLSRPSLRDIQMQQGKQHSLSHTPKTRTAGFSVTSSQGSPSDSPGMNRWFKPEIEAPSSIRSIQIEEKAMRDLKRFYSSVKIVRNQS